MNYKNNDHSQNKSASDYALNNAMAAADKTALGSRPNPARDRAAYEAWYYRLTPAQQQAEWDLYYRQQQRHQQINTQNDKVQGVENKDHTTHAVSASYAHQHVTPTSTNKQDSTNVSLQTATKIKKPNTRTKRSFKQRLSPIIMAVATFSGIMLLAYNQLAIAQVKQYISPSDSLSTPVIVEPTSNPCKGKSDDITIPKIDAYAPVIYDETSWDNDKIDIALERGVVHYGTTALPGQYGNNVILGHSSGNIFNRGNFKYEFVLLDALEEGDTFSLCYKGERYVYKVFFKAIIEDTDFTYIERKQPHVDTSKTPITTLVTCHPPGTNWRRLIVQGEQLSPSPSTAETIDTANTSDIANNISEVPSNSPSFWEKIGNWF